MRNKFLKKIIITALLCRLQGNMRCLVCIVFHVKRTGLVLKISLQLFESGNLLIQILPGSQCHFHISQLKEQFTSCSKPDLIRIQIIFGQKLRNA